MGGGAGRDLDDVASRRRIDRRLDRRIASGGNVEDSLGSRNDRQQADGREHQDESRKVFARTHVRVPLEVSDRRLVLLESGGRPGEGPTAVFGVDTWHERVVMKIRLGSG